MRTLRIAPCKNLEFKYKSINAHNSGFESYTSPNLVEVSHAESAILSATKIPVVVQSSLF